jgi:hypothetical protein
MRLLLLLQFVDEKNNASDGGYEREFKGGYEG